MTSLKNRHAIVTGGGSGVGAAVALKLAESGVAVTILGRREAPLAAVAEQHSYLSGLVCDVSRSDDVINALETAQTQHGPVDIVVANAGMAISQPFAKMQAADLHTMLDVNLFGVINVWQAALAQMKKTGWGRLIAVASTAGLKGYPYVSGYCASKHAVIGLTRALALEVARSGITVNAVCPGYVETPMLESTLANITKLTGQSRDQAAAALKKGNPQNRFIQVTEVADTVAWLCADSSASITGQAISISGGEV